MNALDPPPHNSDLEQSVLSACFLGPDGLGLALELLRPDDFYSGPNRLLFAVFSDMWDRGVPVDLATTTDQLRRRGDLGAVGESYLSVLFASAVTWRNLKIHAEILREYATRRSLMALGTSLQVKARDITHDLPALVSEAEDGLHGVSRNGHSAYLDLSAVLLDTSDAMDRAAACPGSLLGVPTGLGSLDRRTGGLQDGDLVLLGARPSVGKTSLALQVLRATATAVGNAAIVSLEMSRQQLTLRLLSAGTHIEVKRLQAGKLDHTEWSLVSAENALLANLPIRIDDASALSIQELHSRTRRLHQEWPLKLLVVDYLGLMTAPGRDTREQEVSRISRGLKAIAKELHIPVLALSQLSRANILRSSHRPQLSDLRDSGSLEQDADMVIFLHRDSDEDQDVQAMELIIAKQRNGPTGSWGVLFDRKSMRFVDQDTRHQEEPWPASPNNG